MKRKMEFPKASLTSDVPSLRDYKWTPIEELLAWQASQEEGEDYEQNVSEFDSWLAECERDREEELEDLLATFDVSAGEDWRFQSSGI